MSPRGLPRWVLPLAALAGLGAGLIIGIVASNGDTKTVTNTTTTTVASPSKPTKGGARTVRKVRTVVRTRTVTVGAGGGGGVGGGGGGLVAVPKSGQTFSGRNGKTIGALKVPSKSTIEWTNKGDVFTLLSANQIHVSSTKSSGKATLERGTYTQFRVAAIGKWTLRIIPR
jgi:hypothetical protein